LHSRESAQGKQSKSAEGQTGRAKVQGKKAELQRHNNKGRAGGQGKITRAKEAKQEKHNKRGNAISLKLEKAQNRCISRKKKQSNNAIARGSRTRWDATKEAKQGRESKMTRATGIARTAKKARQSPNGRAREESKRGSAIKGNKKQA
jgi:hypothetical protein